MPKLDSIRSRRYFVWGLIVVTAALAGCEHKPQGPGDAGGSAKFVAPKLTETELRALPMSLEMKITSAQWDAANSPNDADKVILLGALYLAHGFPAQGAPCFDQAGRIRPQEFAWPYAAALAYEKAGKRNEAIAGYEATIKLDQNYAPTYLHLADLVVTDDPARAATLYHRTVELDPMNAQGFYGLGRVALTQGHADEALKHFTRAVGLAPEFADAWRGRADAQKALGHASDAEVSQRKADAGGTAPAPEDPLRVSLLRTGLDAETLCGGALILAQQRELDRAEALLKQATDAGATPTQTAAVLGVVRALQGRWNDATAEFQRVLQSDPKSLKAQLGLAQVLGDSGKPAEAEALFRKLIAEQPNQPVLLERFASWLARAKRGPEAVQLVRDAVAADPTNATLQYDLAQILANTNQVDEALTHLRQAISERPEFLGARAALAEGLHSRGDAEGAKLQWQAVQELNPKYAESYLKLAGLSHEAKNDVEAARVLRQGLEQIPDSPDMCNQLAWLLATHADPKLRNGAEAVQLAEKASSLAGNSVHTVLDTLAAAYAEAGRFPDAVKASGKAIELATKAKDAASVAEYRGRLALYQQKKPYHDTE